LKLVEKLRDHKISKDLITTIIITINCFLSVSFLFCFLISKGHISSSYYFIAAPIHLILSNEIFVFLTLILELFLIGWYWLDLRKGKFLKTKIGRLKAIFKKGLNGNNIILEAENEHDLLSRNTTNKKVLGKNKVRSFIDQPKENNLISFENISVHSEKNAKLQQPIFNPSQDISPKGFKELLFENYSIADKTPPSIANKRKINHLSKNLPILKSEKTQQLTLSADQRELLTDEQFTLYMKLVKMGWLYVNDSDKKRIKLTNYSLLEGSFSIGSLKKLIENQLIFKVLIPHFKGPFLVYSPDKTITKGLVSHVVLDLIKKHKKNVVKKRYYLQFWREFGLREKSWEFDITLANPPLLGIIITNPQYDDSSEEAKTFTLSPAYKERIKALLAIKWVKFDGKSRAVIITDLKETLLATEEFIKKMGWGKVEIICFSEENFPQKLENIIISKPIYES
jgi:hypothetical protein